MWRSSISALRLGGTSLRQNLSLKDWAIISAKSTTVTTPGRVGFCPISTETGTGKTHSKTTTVDQDEVDRFSRLAENWWNESGEFGALHTMNDLRIPFVKEALISSMPGGSASLPLHGVKILDVGCGGGILSEPLARLGAQVTGIDASEENIETAKLHLSLDKSLLPRLRYKCITVEELGAQEPEAYDGVVASEIIEHVVNQPQFVKSCCELVRPGGSVFFTTMSRTWLGYSLGIFAAERILRIVPVGIHDWNKFITPEELRLHLKKENFETVQVRGMTMNPLNLKWCWFPDTSVNYALHAVKVKTTIRKEATNKESN